jgi:hypothetical protein
MSEVAEQDTLHGMPVPEPAVPPSEITRYRPGTDTWESMLEEADTVLGFDLAKDELADALVGVDFLVTRLSFRPGIIRDIIADGKKDKKQFAFVSAESVLAPVLNLVKINNARKASGGEEAGLPPLASLEELPFAPGDHIVLNDGSTGVYRDLMRYLHGKGKVIPAAEITDQGEMGESSYDLPPGDWQEVTAGELWYDEDGFGLYTIDVRLRCPRGLRLSRYPNPSKPSETSTTRYIA